MKLNSNQEFVGLLSNDEEYEMYVESEISEAREDARKEGSNSSKLENVKAMLKKNMNINLISEIINLSLDELESIKNNS